MVSETIGSLLLRGDVIDLRGLPGIDQVRWVANRLTILPNAFIILSPGWARDWMPGRCLVEISDQMDLW